MKLLVLSQKEAEQKSKFFDIKTSIISIVCPDEEEANFYNNPNIDKIFRMKFHDLIVDVQTDDKLISAPKQEDFIGLKEFVDNLNCDLLVVHCGAGFSRSAGVAAAINEYFNLDYKFFNNPNFCPNITVYNCCLKELGIAKTKDYYEELFSPKNDTEKLDIFLDEER